MNRYALFGLVFVATSSPALAADNWSGWYAGFNIGANGLLSCNTLTPQGQRGADPAFAADGAELARDGSGCAGGLGANAGVDLGANHQMGNVVTGFETDLDWIGGSTSFRHSGTTPTGNTVNFIENANPLWTGSIRGRIGVVVNDTTLIYGTGGVAIGQVSGNTSETYVAPGGAVIATAGGSGTGIVAGWTAGAGVEVKLNDDWSVKAEANYASLSPMNYEVTYPAFVSFLDNVSSAMGVGTIRIGLNRSLGGGDSGAGGDPSSDPRDWTGFYAGVYGGGGLGRSNATDHEVQAGAGPWIAEGDTFTAYTSGPTGGVEAGYNFQNGALVFGLEGDLGYLGATGTGHSSLDTETVVTATGGPAASLRGRIGVTNGSGLFYGTAGVLVADLGATANDPLDDNDGSSGMVLTSKTGIQVGWIAGGGVEYALSDDWSIKAEGLLYDLGTKRVTGDQLKSVRSAGAPHLWLGHPQHRRCHSRRAE